MKSLSVWKIQEGVRHLKASADLQAHAAEQIETDNVDDWYALSGLLDDVANFIEHSWKS